jgi:hypothetical protein
MGKREKYFRNRSNTGWVRYIRGGIYNTRKQALGSASGQREMGFKARVVQDEKTKKFVVWVRMI